MENIFDHILQKSNGEGEDHAPADKHPPLVGPTEGRNMARSGIGASVMPSGTGLTYGFTPVGKSL